MRKYFGKNKAIGTWHGMYSTVVNEIFRFNSLLFRHMPNLNQSIDTVTCIISEAPHNHQELFIVMLWLPAQI